ncbi:FecR domain-containing protein [Pseudothauera rhizosphaerae]|uniref:FecR family protein n=1 Tax=Pseudothauera rhizosphaerae TaxID=2565932 RepID=A0A4S4AMA9_9RHOO|nr:FecR family protein [Pseudothauera rhizosphaerae]THF60708.1 FecR family protein [Pseudothauera rhizosphaerae]
MNASASRPLDPVAERAIDWLVRLGSGNATAGDRTAFDAWLAADPRHQHAWRTISGLLDQPIAALKEAETRLPGQRRAARLALTAPERRKALRNSAAALLLLGLGGYALDRQQSLTALTADLRTTTGERREVRLADGSTLVLNARSAVDIEFSAQTRLLRLREGEILIHTAPDPARPLIVHTAHGQARALGTRFAVRRQDGHSELAVLEHRVQLTAVNGAQRTFDAGMSARFGPAGIEPLSDPAAARAAWADGQLDVRDRPLGEVIDALRPYKRGYLRVSPQAAGLRVFGVFPLDDPDAALLSLAETQPIAIRRYGPLLTLVEHRSENE